MIHLDFSIVYQIILFVVLWVILDKLMFQPYLHLLAERDRKTTGAQHDSSDLEHEGARLKAQYEEKIAQAQAAGYAAKDVIVQEGRQQREKILSQARDEAVGTLARARNDVASALEQERRLAAAEVSNVAGAMVAKVLGRTVG
ncbi:MAG: H+transporting two-sector ATPase subunit [Deltaproteobacteria bacterium]|nr:H+transporting two-sector ATPase subunit [Deltaproteobacteria bacterium]